MANRNITDTSRYFAQISKIKVMNVYIDISICSTYLLCLMFDNYCQIGLRKWFFALLNFLFCTPFPHSSKDHEYESKPYKNDRPSQNGNGYRRNNYHDDEQNGYSNEEYYSDDDALDDDENGGYEDEESEDERAPRKSLTLEPNSFERGALRLSLRRTSPAKIVKDHYQDEDEELAPEGKEKLHQLVNLTVSLWSMLDKLSMCSRCTILPTMYNQSSECDLFPPYIPCHYRVLVCSMSFEQVRFHVTWKLTQANMAKTSLRIAQTCVTLLFLASLSNFDDFLQVWVTFKPMLSIVYMCICWLDLQYLWNYLSSSRILFL